ncbi:MAG: FUSC family protein, partial [Kofleriaceae bacterium]
MREPIRGARASFAVLLPDLATGIRAALATVVPFGFAAATGRYQLAMLAIGGWLGTLVDPGGARRARIGVLALFSLLGAALVFVGELIGPFPPLVVVWLAAIAFTGSLMRSLGDAGARLGTILAVSAVIAAGKPHADPPGDALYFALGTGVALVLSSIVWPIRTHLPLRRELGLASEELAAYIRAIRAIAHDGAGEQDPRWLVLARTHVRRVRAILESARHTAMLLRTRRSGESTTGSSLRILLGLAEQQFLYLITLTEELRALPPAARDPRWEAALDDLAARFDELRLVVLTRTPHAAATAPPSIAPIHTATPHHAHLTIGELFARLREDADASRRVAAVPETAWPTIPAAEGTERRPAFALRALVRNLRDAIDPGSPFFQHAVRAGIAVAVATLVAFAVSPTHTAWVTVTTLIVLQPYSGATWQRLVERLVGTVLGCALAFAIALVIRAPWMLALAMFPLSMAAVVTRPRSFRLFTLFLTPPFLLLTAPNPGNSWDALARTGDALVGGGIALLASFLVFPSSERRRVEPAVAAMEAAVDRYVDLVLGSLDPVTAPPPREIVDARRAAGVAVGAAEAALEQLLAEPNVDPLTAEHAVHLITYARRITVSTTALDTLAHELPPEAEAELAGLRLPDEAVALRTGARTSPVP